MAEIVPRLVLCLKFLTSLPEIRIYLGAPSTRPSGGAVRKYRFGQLTSGDSLALKLFREQPGADLPTYRKVDLTATIHQTNLFSSAKKPTDITSSIKIKKIHLAE